MKIEVVLFIMLIFNLYDLSDKQWVYVSPQGDDRNIGTKEQPLASLAGARDRVRELRQQDIIKDTICVYVLPGDYFMKAPLSLSLQDTGTEDSPLIFTADPVSKPVSAIPATTPIATPVGWSALTFEHLPLLKHAKMFQWATFHHPGGNSNDFYYPDPNASGYKVMMDIKGPGCLYNWWSTRSMVDSVGLNIYLDGATTPAINTTVRGFTRQMNGIFQVTGQYVSFLPIPFKSGCMVTTNFPAGKTCSNISWGCEEFFHYYMHTYPTAQGVTTYTGSEDLSAIQTIWSNVGHGPQEHGGKSDRTGGDCRSGGPERHDL